MLYKILYQIRRVIIGEHVQIYVIERSFTIIIKLFSKFWERVERKIIKRFKNKIWKYLGSSITLKTRKKLLARVKNWLIRNIKIKKILTLKHIYIWKALELIHRSMLSYINYKGFISIFYFNSLGILYTFFTNPYFY